MKTTTAIAVIAFLLPAAARAAVVDYPALGARLTDLPKGAKDLGVEETFKGYQAEISIGGATTTGVALVSIFRLDAPVPRGNIGDRGYRDALMRQLGARQVNGSRSSLVSIGGRPAWRITYTQPLGPLLAYDCKYYLVAERHLYEIGISAVGGMWRPAGFQGRQQGDPLGPRLRARAATTREAARARRDAAVSLGTPRPRLLPQP